MSLASGRMYLSSGTKSQGKMEASKMKMVCEYPIGFPQYIVSNVVAENVAMIEAMLADPPLAALTF